MLGPFGSFLEPAKAPKAYLRSQAFIRKSKGGVNKDLGSFATALFAVLVPYWAKGAPLSQTSWGREFLYSKRKRAFRRALGFFYRRAASFRRFLVRRFVVLPFLRFVVRCFVLVPFVSMCRPVVFSFVVSVFGRFVVGVLSLRCFVVRRFGIIWNGSGGSMGPKNARIQPEGVQNE